jgi:hypothetical protein
MIQATYVLILILFLPVKDFIRFQHYDDIVIVLVDIFSTTWFLESAKASPLKTRNTEGIESSTTMVLLSRAS